MPVRVLKRVAINCPTGECTYTEYLEIPLDEALLRHIQEGYVPGKPALWSFRIIPKAGLDYRGSLSNAEVAGLLAQKWTPMSETQRLPRRLPLHPLGWISASAGLP